MTELTADIRRTRRPARRAAEPPRRLTDALVAEAPLEADEVAASVKVLPGWACAAIILGLSSALWALIFMAAAALF